MSLLRPLPAWVFHSRIVIPAAVLLSVVGCGSQENIATSNGALSSGATGGATVEPAAQHDTSPPLGSLSPAPDLAGPDKREHPVRPLPQTRSAPGLAADPVVQSNASGAAAPTVGAGFAGVGQGDYGFTDSSAPPDPNLAVGPNHIIQIVNSSFAVFSKTGTLLQGPTTTNTLWSGFGGGCQNNNDGDAVVVYDQLADRFVFTQFSVSTTPFLECVAVSTTGNPTGSYHRYSFQYGNFPDYPKLSVWPDAYYISFNVFNGQTFLGAEVCAYDRTGMLAGSAATQICFSLSSSFGGLLPSTLDGTTAPPDGSPNYFLNFTTSALNLWKFHIDFGTPSNSTFMGPVAVAGVASFSAACNGGACIPQSGTTEKLDSLADRLMYRLAYRNFGAHEALVVNHSVTAGSSVGVRWYEVRSPGASPTVFQQGTFAPDSRYRWMGSAAMDRMGNIGVGYSLSSGSMNPAIGYTGRLASDPLGTLQSEAILISGAGSQLKNLSRWGDYSALVVDPSNDCTFWYTNEYLKSNGTFNWSTRIGSFKFSGCTAPTPDAGVDSAPDVGPPDAAPDAGALPDAGPDAAPDTMIAADAPPDVAPDTTPDAAPDAAPDASRPPVVPPLAADFNGDNKADIGLTAHSAWTSLPVALGQGSGGGFDIYNSPVGAFTNWAALAGVSVLIGDFTGDHKTDVALVGGPWASVPVAIAGAAGTFSIANQVFDSGAPFAGWAPQAAFRVGADFDGDGLTDIGLTGNPMWTSFPVAFSNGDGSFTVRNDGVGSFAQWASYGGVTALPGDFDGDGKMDVALTGAAWTSVPVAFSEGRAPFTVANHVISGFPEWSQSAGVRVAGDFDGDGKADIALTAGPGWASIPVAFSTGRTPFNVTNAIVDGFPTWATDSGVTVLVGDFNGDGKSDLALTGHAGWASVPVALSNGDGTFTIVNSVMSSDFPSWAAQPGVSKFAGDFNGDGKTDIALSGGPWISIPIAFSNGDGTFTITNSIVGDFGSWSAAAGRRIEATP